MHFLEFKEKGFQVFSDFLNEEEINIYKEKINQTYKKQLEEFGEERISAIKENNMVRAPLLYDAEFLKLIKNEKILKIVKDILGEHAILSLQNSIIIPPNQGHHQSFYHRDIIHQDFVSSRPLGINLYFCLDDYNQENGGTCFIAKSHKMDKLPDFFEEVSPNVKAGSVILFDSMIYHKAGINKTNTHRYGINNMFTLPFLKQQINFPYALNGKYSEEYPLNRLLGYHSREFYSVLHFRDERFKRVNK
jgi:ectoine hydroxylase-related dioxygenase (phytanoyl-CoA dioxygenase family)